MRQFKLSHFKTVCQAGDWDSKLFNVYQILKQIDPFVIKNTYFVSFEKNLQIGLFCVSVGFKIWSNLVFFQKNVCNVSSVVLGRRLRLRRMI